MLAARTIFAAALLFWLAAAGPARADTADTVEWLSARGSVAARGSARWLAPPGAPPLPEWHYRGRGDRRYQQNLAVWASPAVVVVDGRPMAFIGGYDQAMHALDLAAKEQAWVRITNGAIQAAPAVGLVDGEQVVFWGSADRTVYAHRARDGELVWTREVVVPTSTMGEAVLSSPLLHDGLLFITCFVHDRALGRSTQLSWLVALNQADGKILWRQEVSQGPVSSPVGREIDGRFVVFVAARKGLLQAFAVTAAGPEPLWQFQMPHEVLGSPAVEEDTPDPLLFLGSKFGNLIAVDARTGRERWQRMAGNWIDNTAAVGVLDGEAVVFAGSHDYYLYAFAAGDGRELWRRRLGGEVYSAPAFFDFAGEPHLAAATLDDRVYIVNARNGLVRDAYRTGEPIWDLLGKGEVLWASPVVVEAGEQPMLVHGSYSDVVYILPLDRPSGLRVGVQSPATLWISMGVVLCLFLFVILPPVLLAPVRDEAEPNEQA